MRSSWAFAQIPAVAAALALAGCSQGDALPASAGYGPAPHLVAPNESLIPTLNIAPAVGWKNGAHPVAAPGFRVAAFAQGLDHPRFVYVLPNGDVLAVESAAPGTDNAEGIRGWVQTRVMKRAGSIVPSANRITLLRDADGDGVAETRSVFLTGLNSPFGVVLVGDMLYVANCDSVVRYPYAAGETAITAAGTKIADLPAGRNHHWTKPIVASADGQTLYVSVGSNSNIAEHGMAEEKNRASILAIDAATGRWRIYAGGIRNGAGLAFNPESGELWVASNERDEIGDDVPPDYMTHVVEGGFYGWPYSYWGQHVDTRVTPQRPDLVAKAITPDYALGPHTASLGLVFYEGTAFPERYKGGAFVGQHGSWNRSVPSGYKVVFVPFANGRPNGMAEDVLTGFLNADGDAMGRPVGVAVDNRGALLVADDVGNTVWRVSAGSTTAAYR